MAVAQQTFQTQRSRSYVAEQVNTMTPMELLVKIYDLAIVSCRRQDKERLSRCLVELIAALNFEYKEIAVGLLQLYNFCLRNAKMGRFDQVEPIMIELRDAWQEAMALQDAKMLESV